MIESVFWIRSTIVRTAECFKGWRIWEVDHYVDMPGYYGAYFYGRKLGERVSLPVSQALERGDAVALRKAGDAIRRVLTHQPWMTSEARIAAILAMNLGAPLKTPVVILSSLEADEGSI